MVVGSGAYTGAFFPWTMDGILQTAFGDKKNKTGSIRFAVRVDEFMMSHEDQTVFMVGRQRASSGLLLLHDAFPRMELKDEIDFINRRRTCAENQIFSNNPEQRQAGVRRQVRLSRVRCGIDAAEAPIHGPSIVTKVLMCVQCGEEIIPASRLGIIMEGSYNYPSNVQKACLCITTKDEMFPKFCDKRCKKKNSVPPKKFIGGKWCVGRDGTYHAACYGEVNS
jgi:hypothetical protein